jgi:phosphoribosylformylglycinamidine synthase
VTDNLNFGNPEKPEVMGQLAACIGGMAAACAALDFPVVSGNVSLYNETAGAAILPTPAIGGLGVLDDAARSVGIALSPALDLLLVGSAGSWLGQSLWLREILLREAGQPPPVDLAAERRHGDFVRTQILQGRVAACHDVSDGGLLVAVAEMALAGDCGARLDGPSDAPFWFGEDQARYVLAVADGAGLLAAAGAAKVPARRIGRSGGDGLTLPDGATISLKTLRQAHEAFLPAWLDSA